MLLDCSPGPLEVHWTTRFLIAFLMLSLNCVSWKCLRHLPSWIYLVDTKEKVQCNRMYYIDTLDVWVTRSLEYLCTHSNCYLILCQVLFVSTVSQSHEQGVDKLIIFAYNIHMTEESGICTLWANHMNITDCVQQIRDGLTVFVEGQKIDPQDFFLKDNWGIGYEFVCPYCSDSKTKSYKKKQRCARIYPLTGCYTYQFRCKRCKRKMSIHQFLEERFPLVYRKYKAEKNADKQMKRR